LDRGDSVIGLDNLYTGNLKNIAHLQKNRKFKFLQHDVIEPVNMEVDEIYNLACPASPVHYQAEPIKTLQTSVYGAVNMLSLAKSQNAKIFQASTSEIYGDPVVHPQKESYWGNVNSIGPRSCYDEGKRSAETLFFDYYRNYNLDVRVARIFNTYGPRMSADDGRVVSNVIVQALMGEDISIYGDGTQTRSFCFVDDLIDGFIRFMDLRSPDSGQLGFPGPMNLGNPNEFTILELAEMIIHLTGSKSKLVFLDLPVDDPKQRQPDITLARDLLNGWSPQVELEEGLLQTIKYFKKMLLQDR
jgi:UDP-glucuronate decarboxylase